MSLPLLEVPWGDGVRAAFTTRHGGVSVGAAASLNLSTAVGDDPAAVLSNRRAVAEAFGAPLALGIQVHGADVAEVTVAGPVAAVPLEPMARGDGLVTTARVLLGVLVADCVPVLLADPVARVVGTAHAGRAGVVAGVVPNTVARMIALGARAGRIRAAVGPAICGRCYEVGEDLRAEVAAVVPIAYATTSWGTAGLDLPAAVRHQLTGAGVRDTIDPGWCTLEDERFYSHRGWARTGERRGRQAGLVVLTD